MSSSDNSLLVAEEFREDSFGGKVPLENGDHLNASEFLRRFENMPEVKKAELIQGIVYMASPVGFTFHAEPDGLIQGWLSLYASKHGEIHHAINSTLRLGPDDVVQPDGLLVSADSVNLDEKGYLIGPVGLVVEIAASSASIDFREKRVSYRRCGVKEFLLWRTREKRIDWWHLESDEIASLPVETDGTISSKVCSGLKLNVKAALDLDAAKVLAEL